MFVNASNNAISKLASDRNETNIGLTVEDGSQFPEENFLITINNGKENMEIVRVTRRDGNAFLGLKRGQEGTTPQSHDAGSTVENNFTAGTYQALVDEVNKSIRVVDSEVGEDFGCIKYSNGMMECWARVKLTYQANTRMGGYWTFDYEFISPPNVTFTVDNNGTSITPSVFEVGNNYIRNITNKDVEITVGRVYGMTNYADGDVMYVFARAIGKWK